MAQTSILSTKVVQVEGDDTKDDRVQREVIFGLPRSVAAASRAEA
jgi:hypothetical protein